MADEVIVLTGIKETIDALKDNGRVVKPFGPEFLDTLESVEMISDPNSESTEIA